MGVNGLFSYIRKENIPGAMKTLKKGEIISEIEAAGANGEIPKIIINLWAFCNYFEDPLHFIVGGRLNVIRQTFETFLKMLKDAGAQLIFVFKKTAIIFEANWIDERNSEYARSMKCLELLETKTTAELYDHLSLWFNRWYPMNAIVSNVLCQVAAGYGKFYGNDLFLIKETAGHVEMANNEKAFAIIGLDTYYLCFEGSWKFWSPKRFNINDLVFEEFNRQVILDYHGFTFEKLQLFALLAGKLKTDLSNNEIISNFFKIHTNDKKHDFKKIFSFVNSLQMPLTRATFEQIVKQIFGTTNDKIVQDFESSMKAFTPAKQVDETERFTDKTVEYLIKDVPMSVAELVLHKRVLSVNDTYSVLNTSDMKSVKDLTLPFWTRTMGLLLQHVEGEQSRSFMSPVDETIWEKAEIDPEYPQFNVPFLRELVVGNYDKDLKIQTLLFLVGDVVSEANVKQIAKKYLIHFILLSYLVRNDSTTPHEACAMMKSIVDVECDNIPRIFVFPESVNVRAFRVTHLYMKMYYILICCMNAVGLSEFVADIKVDNAHFQNLVREAESNDKRSIAEQLMDIINS